jgi:asparaginyl-tRNA synthetase
LGFCAGTILKHTPSLLKTFYATPLKARHREENFVRKTIYVEDLLHRLEDGSQVDVLGWVKTRRKHSHVIFLDVCDSTGSIQVVVDDKQTSKKIYELAKKFTPETAVKITGILVSTNHPKPHSKEIQANNIEVIGHASLNICPQPRSDFDIFEPHLQEQLLNYRHFYLRNEKIAAILRFRHLLTGLVHNWFRQHEFMEIHAPVLTPTPLYDDRTPIGLNVHGQNVFLTQCVGFYLEQAVHSFEKIYNIGPSFRAEESRSKRHLMEYWHIKAELAFIDFEGLISVVESLIHDVTQQCLYEGAKLAKTVGTVVCDHGLKNPFPRIDYIQAVEWLQDQGCDIQPGKSLGSDEEEKLSQRFVDTPFWVVGIPRSIEPFPYVINPDDPNRTKTADLIASCSFGELLGIAEKIHTLPMLDERLKEKGKTDDPRYEWLRELRQFGCVPHGGFGMGLERLIRWLLQIPHVRDTIPFHRAFGRKIHP